jgi:acetyl esterase/lipase
VSRNWRDDCHVVRRGPARASKRHAGRIAAAVVLTAALGCGQAVDIPAATPAAAPVAAPGLAVVPKLADLEQAVAPYQDLDWKPGDLSERTLIPYAMLQVRKAHAASRSSYYSLGGASTATMVRQGLTALELVTQGKALKARPGALCELAYIAGNDHTAQPYYLYLPQNFDDARQWPLLVFLHGYVPSTSLNDPWILSDDSFRTAERYGFIFLTVYGRRNSDFQGVGELDLEEAIREVSDLYPIDPDRVHLTGVSMGGAGCYYIGLRRPGRYASFTSMDGQTDMHAWWPRVLRDWPASRDGIPPFRRWLVEWDNPVDLVMNARNQRFFVLHGERDPLVSVEQSREFVRLAKDQGIELAYYEVPEAGHYIYWEPAIFDKAWNWQKDLRREPRPRRVTYKTFSLEYDRAFWCRIGDFRRWGVPATIDVSVSDDGTTLTAKTENVRCLAIDPAVAPIKAADGLKAMVNGAERPLQRNAAGELEVVCDDAPVPEATWPPRKRHGLSGPIEEAFDTPFVVVTGTAGDEADDKLLAAQVEKWADEWDRFADGRPPVLLDSQVTDEVVRRRSLILFGAPETNSLLARLHERLPLKIGRQRFEVAGRTYEGPDLGLVLCYPNPLNPERYVVIYSGQLYGEKCGINHKHDLLPDFIVFTTRNFSYDDTNEHEVAGFFDLNWRLVPELTWARRQ